MIKTLSILLKQDKERFVVPKGVQDVIPVKAIYDDGIFQVGRDKFTRSFKFTDINYAVASREDKEAMFLEYSELLNSFDSGATTKITINNRRLNRLDFEKTILMPLKGDALDEYREEYNKMLLERATGANAYTQEKYITISVNKKNVEEARSYFARVGADLIAHFGRLGSKCVEMETDERLRIFHDFYRAGEETSFRFDMKETRKKGHDFKDFICPDSMEFEKDYFKIGERYGRVLFLREYASYIKDAMVAELTDLNRNLMLSIDVVPVPTDEAVREAENRLLGVETNVTNWQRRQNSNNNFSAQVPYDLEQQRKEMKEFLDDLTTRDQRMMFAVLTMVHTADSKEQLDSDTEALLTTARKHLCQFGVLKFQQLDGLNTVMPFGTRKIDTFRTLTTESLAVFIPFRVQDIYHENGIYYGQNVISKNMIIADRRQLLNGNEFILGVSGGGKSFAAKGEIINQKHYRCANYKSGRGNCQIHYIRNVVLEKIVLEAINSLADFVRCYEPVFLYLMAQKDIVSKRTETNRLKSSIESGKRRIQDLDKLIERIYEDQVLGNISAERYARMSINYENEQRELVKRVDEDEKRLVSIEQTSLDLKTLLKVLRSNTAFEELTPTLVNSLIRRIEVHNNDKSSGHCSVKVDIYFTAIGLIDIPTEDEIKSLMEKIQSNPQEYRLTA